MRAVFLSIAIVLTGCSARSQKPTVHSPAPAAMVPAVPQTPLAGDLKHHNLPRVVRRILAEEQELVAHSVAMANELPDASGKERALAEAKALEAELSGIEAPIDDADSDALDRSVTQLIQLDTRIALLHDKLRTATSRRTALAPE